MFGLRSASGRFLVSRSFAQGEDSVDRCEVCLRARDDDVGVGTVAVKDTSACVLVLRIELVGWGLVVQGRHADAHLAEGVDPLGYGLDRVLEKSAGHLDERLHRLVDCIDRTRPDRGHRLRPTIGSGEAH